MKHGGHLTVICEASEAKESSQMENEEILITILKTETSKGVVLGRMTRDWW